MTSEGRSATAGVQFAAIDGRRSSQRAGKAIFADAVREVDETAAVSIERAKDWRKGYLEPVKSIVGAGARSSKDALRIASDGLDSVRRNLVFVRGDDDVPLDEAIKDPGGPVPETTVIEGRGAGEAELEVPYRGERLRGDRLLSQVDRWVETGVMERSCAEALRLVVQHPEWLDLSDRTIVLLGAASEMGPLIPLSKWRANIGALDLPRRYVWEHILEAARTGNGRVSIPLAAGASGDLPERAGIDLMTDAPLARAWVDAFEGPLTVGNYVYADGAQFVRLAAVVDSLVQDVLSARSDVSSAYLATPTDVFAVPEEIATEARAARRSLPHHGLLRPMTGSRLYKPNYDRLVDGEGRRWGLSDGLVPIQGANYALAKSIQRWRAVVTREEARLSSANVAPASHTRSVTKNKLLAAAYRGAPRFGVEIFDAATTRVLMAALLVHDLRAPGAAARPEHSLDHPYDLFVQGALHGGIWRLGYEPRTVLPLALLRGALTR